MSRTSGSDLGPACCCFARASAFAMSRTSFPDLCHVPCYFGLVFKIIFCLRRVSHFFSKPSSCLGLLFLNFSLRGVSHFFSRPWPHPVSLLTNFFPLFFAFAVSPASFPGLCPVSCYFSLTFAFVLSRTSFPNLGRVSC